MKDFRAALALLTIIPMGEVRIGDSPLRTSRAYAYFPCVGFFLGLLLAAATLLLRLIFPNWIAAVLVVALWAILTGGLHLDGFADACDALFAATTRARRLEILRDVHLGTFGVVGLVLLLALKIAALASLKGDVTSPLLAPILARWAMVYAATYPLARSDGMAAMFRAELTRREILIATIFAMLFAAAFGWFGLAAFIAAFLIATMIARFALARLGGLTGDVYGMICESVEVAVLLVGNVT